MAKRRAGTAEKRRLSTGTTTATVSAWEDDPGSGVRVTRLFQTLQRSRLPLLSPNPLLLWECISPELLISVTGPQQRRYAGVQTSGQSEFLCLGGKWVRC